MFRRLPDPGAGPDVGFTFDGVPMTAKMGDSVACALLAAGIIVCRSTAVSGAPRAPYCLMGVCYECLVTIDGRANQQGCMVEIRDGMRIMAQAGKISPSTPSMAESDAPRGSGS
jgi:predicted molibdopterin-dependent oxidoreductase YjgC